MKSSFIIISPAALFGVFLIGSLWMDALYSRADPRTVTLDIAISILMALMVRSDVRQSFRGGKYTRGWFAWEWQNDSTTGEAAE